MSRTPIPLSVMFIPFLLSIQIAVCSLAKPIEDGSNNDFNGFPAASDLIPDPSHGWTQRIQNFGRLDSQPQTVSQSQPDSSPLWASSNENSDRSETTLTLAQGSPCRAGQDGIHRRDRNFCTLDRETGGAKDEAQAGAQQGLPEGAAQGAREEEGVQREGTAQTEEEIPTIAPVWTPPNIYDPEWHKELDEAMGNMRIARERNKIPHGMIQPDAVTNAVGAGIYLEVDNCDWLFPAPSCAKEYDLCCEAFMDRRRKAFKCLKFKPNV